MKILIIGSPKLYTTSKTITHQEVDEKSIAKSHLYIYMKQVKWQHVKNITKLQRKKPYLEVFDKRCFLSNWIWKRQCAQIHKYSLVIYCLILQFNNYKLRISPTYLIQSTYILDKFRRFTVFNLNTGGSY